MSFAQVRQYVNRSLVTMLILGVVNLTAPAAATASVDDNETSRTEATSRTAFLTPGVLQRSIAVAAHRAALQPPQTGKADAGHSRKGCLIGGVLLGGAAAAFVTAWAKHRSWADSGATTTPGAKPPSSVGWSVAVGGVLAGAGIFTMSKTCGE